MMLTSSASPTTTPPWPPLTQFTWGLDLSGQNGNAPPWQGGVSESPAGLHGAGGIGGLLGMVDTKSTSTEADDAYMIYFYDDNGNVGQVIDARAGSAYFGQTAARYEYYPFGGNLLSAFARGTSGPKNPFLFSTKYRDSETGLYYYGERYLLPRLGRWLNRDPIGELGGQNLYRATRNDPVNRVDADGKATIDFWCRPPPPTEPGPYRPPRLGPTDLLVPPCPKKSCEDKLAEARKNSEVASFLLFLEVARCPVSITCDDLGGRSLAGGVIGGKTRRMDNHPQGSNVRLDRTMVEMSNHTTVVQLLLHELTHAFQNCRNDGKARGAREVEACTMSGQCNPGTGFGNTESLESRCQCVYRCALNSCYAACGRPGLSDSDKAIRDRAKCFENCDSSVDDAMPDWGCGVKGLVLPGLHRPPRPNEP